MKRVKGYISTRPLGSYDFEFFVEDSMTDQEIKNKVEDMSTVGLESYNRVNDRLHILQAAMTGSKVEITLLSKKREHPMKQLQA